MKKILPAFLLILVSCVPWNTAPECKIISPENGSEYQRGEEIEVYIKATDDRGINEVRLYLDGIGIASMPDFPYSYTIDTEGFEIGSHSLKAEVMDNLGKESDADVSFTINSGLPIVETLQPVLIAENAVIAGGTLLDDGGGTVTATGILWNIVPYDVAGSQTYNAQMQDNTFTVRLSGLDYITYYATAFAENESGRTYGEELSITVPVPEPDPLP